MRLLDNVTLIMTVLNERRSLPGFLASLENQTAWPGEFVVVDGGSTDRTQDLLREWSDATGIKTSIIDRPGVNISQGRNIAIETARTEFIAATDAGTELRPDWLEQLAAGSADGADIVAGFFEPQFNAFWSATIGAAITPTISEIDGKRFLPSSRSVLFRRSTWKQVGGYPEWLDYCEDLTFDLAMMGAGARCQFAPQAIVTWDARPDLKSYAKQYFRYARGDGKAGLWPRRHLIRYASYAAGLALVGIAVHEGMWVFGTLAIGGLIYLQKFLRRVITRRRQIGRKWLASLAAVPLVVLVGDIAKMVGYPIGYVWRRNGGQALSDPAYPKAGRVKNGH